MIIPAPHHRLIARCLLLEEGRILLVSQKSLKTGRSFWTLPGGLVDPGEPLAEGALRELREETGLEGEVTGIVLVQELPHANLLEVFLRVAHPRGEMVAGQDPEPGGQGRILEVRWFPLEGMPPLHPAEFFRDLADTGTDGLRTIAPPNRMLLD